ncbi:MAG: phosphate-starvation-inducible protein PsiE [Acidiferrobacterales bacterium]
MKTKNKRTIAARSGQTFKAVPRVKGPIDKFGIFLVEAFQLGALFVIGGTIVWAAVHEYVLMIQQGRATLDGILLLFIYLEMGAMVGIYFKTDRLPVRFLLYIAITVLTRFLAVDLKDLTDEKIVVITGAILILTLAILVLQLGASKFPSKEETY